MDVSQFVDAQKTHYTVYPELSQEDGASYDIPFVTLLDGKEPKEAIAKRWELYHQLHSHFHLQVDDIVENIETDLAKEILSILFDVERQREPACFRTLFLLGSDSTTNIELPAASENTLNALIELTPKESPNVRMMLRRSMFKLVTIADTSLHQESTIKKEIEDSKESMEEIQDDSGPGDVSYDLSLVENFKKLFGKDLCLVFNFKDVDSFSFYVLDNFMMLLKSALKHPHVKISLVLNVNTNLSNIEKNLAQSTMRFLKRDYYALDVSSNKGFKYGNRIFQGFLDTVDSKLNLSDRFVQFILDKMANNSNHNLQLLTKILDYALMSYFYQNPFSVFIDPVNIEFLDSNYLSTLTTCPTFMFFIEGLIKENAPCEEVMALLDNKDKTLEEFFIEFLVRENPINRHAKKVARYLEEKLDIKNYNLIELYHHMLVGNLQSYLERWPKCSEFLEELNFEPVDTIFQELFTIDNSNDLLSQALFPYYKTNLENNMLNWERILPAASLETTENSDGFDLDRTMSPVISQLFKLYREASYVVNIYDFYIAFKETLPSKEVNKFLKSVPADESLEKFLTNNNAEERFDKVALILFMQAIFDFEHMGLIKTQGLKHTDALEKCIWRGV